MKRKLILKSIICLILLISMMIPNVVLAESITNGVAEPEYTDVVLYAENNCVVPNNIILEGKSVSVSDGSIESLPSMVEELDKRIALIEKQQPSIFLNNQPVISEDAYSLSTSFYLNSRLKLNALVASVNDITIQSSIVEVDADGFAILYSQKGNINISTSQTSYNGIIYAPYGDVVINASDFNFKGVIVAKNIYINSWQSRLQYDSRIETYMPSKPNLKEKCYSKPMEEDDIVLDYETKLAYVKNQVILTANQGVIKSQIEELLKQHNAKIVGYLPVSRNYQIEFTADHTTKELDDISNSLKENELIETCSTHMVLPFDFNSVAPTYTPEDPWGGSVSWNESQPYGDNWWAEAINARYAWEHSDKMKPVKVGIIDTKCFPHEDLKEVNILKDKYWKEPGKGDATPKYHATLVAGIIGAVHNNKGISGVATNAELYNTPFLHQKIGFWGTIFGVQEFKMYEDLEVLIVENNVKVINASLGTHNGVLTECLNDDANDMPLKDGIQWHKALDKECEVYLDDVTRNLKGYLADGHEFLIVQAAGNLSGLILNCDKTDETFGWLDTKYNGYFGAITDRELKDRIIVVGSITNKKNGTDKYSVSDFSCVGKRVDIFAPGEDIYGPGLNNGYIKDNGTSFAAPQVTGVASMVWGVKPNLSAKEVKKIIVENYTESVMVPRKHPTGSVSYVENSEAVFTKPYPVLDAQAAINFVAEPIYEIELEWGNKSPDDMDLYFKYPGYDIEANYVCFYNPKLYAKGELLAEHLYDVRSKPGKEKIKIYTMTGGTSECKVVAKKGIDRYATSDVKVRLYKYGRLMLEFTPPKEDIAGEGWNVFNIVDDKIVIVNTIEKL